MRTAKSGGVVKTYSYDSQNRLVGYSSPTTSATYAYDVLDRRIAKTVDGTVTAYVYDPWGLDSTASDVLLDFEAGALTKRWLHGPQVDEPLGFEAYSGNTAGGTGTAHEVFADRLGSVIEVVEAATGTVVSRQRFDSFGLRTATGPLLQRYGFTGREHDAESGLIYYRARAYDPAVGMFLQRDPIGFAAGDLNLYAYTWNDPYNWKDPSGLAVATDFSMFTAFTVGLAGTSCLILEPCKDGLDDAGKAVVGGTARGIGGLFAAIGRLINRMNDALFSQGNDGSGSGGSGDGEDESNGGERSGPKTGNPGLDGLLEGSSKGDRGPKGWETPGTRGKFEERLKGLPGAEQNPTDNGGTSTTFPDGTKIDTYPGRVSTGRPGWSVTKPGGKPGKLKGSFLE